MNTVGEIMSTEYRGELQYLGRISSLLSEYCGEISEYMCGDIMSTVDGVQYR